YVTGLEANLRAAIPAQSRMPQQKPPRGSPATVRSCRRRPTLRHLYEQTGPTHVTFYQMHFASWLERLFGFPRAAGLQLGIGSEQALRFALPVILLTHR